MNAGVHTAPTAICLARRQVRASGVLYLLDCSAVLGRSVIVVRSLFGALYCVECESADCLHVAFVAALPESSVVVEVAGDLGGSTTPVMAPVNYAPRWYAGYLGNGERAL